MGNIQMIFYWAKAIVNMGIHIFKQLGDEWNILISATGHMLNIFVKAETRIKIEWMILAYMFLVVEQLSQYIILGLDLLEHYSAKMVIPKGW